MNTPQKMHETAQVPCPPTLREQMSEKVECRECNGTGQIPAGIDREAGRDPGRDCWKCHGYGEHIR